MSPDQTMQVKVFAPFKVYYEGPAKSLSGVNDTGPFDILAGHKNFMSLLKPGELAVTTPDHREIKLPIKRGVMHVKADKITVFLDV
ncbi:hypothetical protein A2884_02480 [Candidatus Saccharibacteria bacterium RIFCSPHIGHO2_01_FULL_48_12]|nr:MAG: hypothetical protein A2884_02480 [Candidatus Saccharibacteria bacterium RIFCSPHIGHO2_01_FULL_48_12]